MHETLLLIELLTDELRRLVGHGCGLQRLPLLPTLREVAQVGDAGLRKAGFEMLAFIRGAIASLHGSYQYLGQVVSADVLRRCFLVLMKLEASNEGVELRRYRVIARLQDANALGIVTPEQWRVQDGRERALLHILAEHMVHLSIPVNS
jgi:hypothetical protein